ncbi:MAG: hypothetical protein ACFNZW_08685 [Coriobacteriaceae bacterium]
MMLDRASCERLAIAYLAEHSDWAECTFRFDYVNMLIVNGTRAILRHHHNAFGTM